MTIDTTTREALEREALEAAHTLLAAEMRDKDLAAQEKRIGEERAALAVHISELRAKFSRFISGAAKAADAADDDDADNEEDSAAGESEDNESQRAQVLAFYESQPGKRIPLPLAIEKLPDVPEKIVRDYSSKFAKPGGPLKRVKRGVYRYVGKAEE